MAAAWIMMLAMLLTALAGCADSRSSGPRFQQIVIAGHTFKLEVAVEPGVITQGLMNRQVIPEDGGMLFVFPDAQVRSFWMGHCLVDIDLIFVDSRGRITALHRMRKADPPREGETEAAYRARLPSYWSNYPAQFAIELKSGWLDQLDLHLDERIEADWDDLKSLAE